MLSRLDVPVAASLVFALAFATAQALLRPAFQLSDEVYYFASVQPVERLHDASPACRPIAIPVAPTDPARPLFRAIVSPLLFEACEATASPTTALHLTRAVLGLGLVVIVWAAWQGGRLLAKDAPEVAWLAAAMTASHPVLATMSAGITPSALSDPMAALACLGLVGAATAAGGRRIAWLGLAIATSVLAMLAKDSAIGLAAVTIAGGPFLVLRPTGPGRPRGGWPGSLRLGAIALLVSATIAVLVAIVVFDGGPFQRFRLALDTGGAIERVFAFEVVARTVSSLPQYYWSYIGNLGNFGGNSVQLPAVISWIVLAAALLAGAGLARHRNARERVETAPWRRLTVLFGVLTVVLLFQAPVRDAMVGMRPGVQGRWLFPAMVPFALWSCLGLLAWAPRPGRVVPLLSLLITTVPCVALFWVIVPHFYTAFPQTYNVQGLFLAGPFGAPLDQALLAPFLGPPAWLADSRVAWLLMLGMLVSAVWMVAATTRCAESGPSTG